MWRVHCHSDKFGFGALPTQEAICWVYLIYCRNKCAFIHIYVFFLFQSYIRILNAQQIGLAIMITIAVRFVYFYTYETRTHTAPPSYITQFGGSTMSTSLSLSILLLVSLWWNDGGGGGGKPQPKRPIYERNDARFAEVCVWLSQRSVYSFVKAIESVTARCMHILTHSQMEYRNVPDVYVLLMV